MTTATPPAGRIARLWAVIAARVSQSRRDRKQAAETRTGPAVRVEAVQLAAGLAGLAAFVVAGFLWSLIAGFVVLGLVLLVAGNVRV